MSAVAALARSEAADRFGALCHLVLKMLGWVSITCCCVVTLWVGLFVLLGEFSFSQTVLHIDNFASRYVAAAAVRQHRFENGFWLISAFAFGVMGFLRRHALPGFRVNGKENGDG